MVKHEKTAQIQQKIISSVDDLLYQKGFNLMSFSDIARVSGIPRGNLNYHFKTKEQILTAVIEYRISRTQSMLDDWNETIPTPLERLKRFTQIPINELKNVRQFGCPMGSLNTELKKTQPELQQVAVKQLHLFKQWLEVQFRELSPMDDAEKLALHLLTRIQGIAVVAQAFDDDDHIRNEVDGINTWLDVIAELP